METNKNGSQIKNYLEKYPIYNTMWEPQETSRVPPTIYSLLWSHLHFLERQWLLRGPPLTYTAWEGLLACAVVLTHAWWWVPHAATPYGPTSTGVVVETRIPRLWFWKRERDNENGYGRGDEWVRGKTEEAISEGGQCGFEPRKKIVWTD